MADTHEISASESLREEISIDDLRFWKQQLSSGHSTPELPTDFTGRLKSTDPIALPPFQFSRSQSEEILLYCQETGADLYTFLLTCYFAFLYRYTNQEDLIVGCYKFISARVHNNEGVLDCLESKMAIKTNLSGDLVSLELQRRVSDSVFVAEDHQALPLCESLVESLRKEGVDLAEAFRISFNFFSTDGEPEGRNRAAMALKNTATDFGLVVFETINGVSLQWYFDPALFFESSIRRMSAHFQILLFGILADPQKQVSKLPLLSTEERITTLFEWNDTTVSYPSDRCLHNLFEEQVNVNPDALALELYVQEGPSEKLTYQQLNKRANQLAHYLIHSGVGPDVLVGICLERSPELVIGLLAVLKAGGAYVPLDPVYPSERLRFMIEDSGIKILVTSSNLLEKIRDKDINFFCIDREEKKLEQLPVVNPVTLSGPNNLAYIIYTSGSTGLPKGTMIEHRGVVNYLSWCVDKYTVADGFGAPVNSSIAFDATITSLFAPLVSGKKVLLMPEKDEIEALSNTIISNEQISLIKITPAHLDILKHLLPADRIKNKVNALVIGGEALVANKLDFWRSNAPSTRLINEYGPTETVVGCCIYEVDDLSSFNNDVPIGKPIANIQMYVLDRHMQPVPIGVTGEIYIGGAGVARGYLNRSELTEQRFVPNPFTDRQGERLYKTGDLACYLADGNIMYKGRVDHQVKIRGYRIELGEIEAVLATHPRVAHSVASVNEDSDGGKTLIAYLVCNEQRPAVNDLRLFIRDRLPEYMVPARYVFLRKLPLTPNGKVDRKALAGLNETEETTNRVFKKPQTDTERSLTEIFQRGLKLKEISVDDNFFEIGGNSIQAAGIFSQVNQIFGKGLPLSTLLKFPTIEALSSVIEKGVPKEAHTSLVPIQPHGSRPPLFCVHGGFGNVLFYQHLSRHLGNDQPLYGLQAKGLNGEDKPYGKLEEMAAHYIRELKSVQPVGPYYIAGYCFGAIAALEMACQLKKGGETVAFVGSFNGISPVYNEQTIAQAWKGCRQFPLQKRLRYIFRFTKQRLKFALAFGRFHVGMTLRGLRYKLYFLQRKSLPETLRRLYVIEATYKAQRKYKGQIYPGNLVIFRSPKIYRDPHLGWTSLISGEIQTIDIPGAHPNRRWIMYEPFVQSLAAEVRTQMDKAMK